MSDRQPLTDHEIRHVLALLCEAIQGLQAEYSIKHYGNGLDEVTPPDSVAWPWNHDRLNPDSWIYEAHRAVQDVGRIIGVDMTIEPPEDWPEADTP